MGDRLVDLHRANGETANTATFDDIPTGAPISRWFGTTSVVRTQFATAFSAYRKTLQQSVPFSHSATTYLMRTRMSVSGDPCAISLVGIPINITFAMIRNKNRPL